MRTYTVLVASMLSCAGLVAQESFIVGPRSLAMGGTGVAIVDDGTAQVYNPAMFGFYSLTDGKDHHRLASDNNDIGRKDWGIDLVNINVGFQDHGDLLDQAQAMADLNLTNFGNGGVATASEVSDAVTLGSVLPSMDDPGNVVSADASASFSLRIGHFAIGARIYSDASALVRNVDTVNVGFASSGATLGTAINSSGSPTDGTIQALSSAQSAQLQANLGNNVVAVEQLDLEMRRQGLNQHEIDNAFLVLNNAALGTGGALDTNTTTIRLSGFALGEIPISYGHAFNEHISVGATVKLMFGRVYGNETSVFKDGAATSFGDVGEEFNESMNVGLDVAFAYRIPWFQAGVIARNINAPTFSGFISKTGVHFADVQLDPQIAIGLALIPRAWVTLALDADLLAVDTTYGGYQSQRLGAGIEFTPGHVVALRTGVYTNLAESDIGPAVTAGLGINLWLFRIDLAGAISLDTVEVDGSNIPREARASFGLMIDF